MEIDDEKIEYAVRRTVVLRPPKQRLATFGTTNIYYYLVSEPSYAEPETESGETVIREGRIIAEKPKIVTPYYLAHLEGFGAEARKYFDTLMRDHGANAPGLFYTYRNEPKQLNVVADNLLSVVGKLNAEIEQSGDPLTSIIKAYDPLWDVSLMKFIFEMTQHSLESNIRQLGSRLDLDTNGVPMEARLQIERLFLEVNRGEVAPADLRTELERWGLFEEYEDRFLSLFRK